MQLVLKYLFRFAGVPVNDIISGSTVAGFVQRSSEDDSEAGAEAATVSERILVDPITIEVRT